MIALELFEHFNTTNQTSPHFEAHKNYAKPVVPDRCETITLLDVDERCAYAMTSAQCSAHVYLINYNRFFYCTCDINDLFRITCIILIFVCCALQFWLIYVTTNDFFVPALQATTKLLNLNEYIAGVTVMTIGNNASDLVSTFLGVDSRARHIYTDSMSIGMFNILTSAMIIWCKPFAIEGSYFLRETGFVLLYVSYVDLVFKIRGGTINIMMAGSMSSIYLVYITVMIIDEYIQFLEKRALKKKSMLTPVTSNKSLGMKLSGAFGDMLTVYQSPNRDLFKQFIRAFDLLDRSMFNSRWTIFKIWALVKFPSMLLIRLLIPQMNFDNSGYKWSKLLCCIQIWLTPSGIAYLIVRKNSVALFGLNIPIILIFSLCMIPFSVLAFYTSRTDGVPNWYICINLLSGVSCVFAIYLISKELISSLETLGITLNRSHTFIGCTLYTWGSGLSDMLANITIARRGYPRMAFAACLGGTIFGIFTSICVPILYKTIQHGEIKLSEGTVGETTSILLIISIITLIFYGVTTNFMLRRTGALIGISLYILLLIFIVSSEFELTHAFGTDHSLDRGHFSDTYFELDGKIPKIR